MPSLPRPSRLVAVLAILGLFVLICGCPPASGPTGGSQPGPTGTSQPAPTKPADNPNVKVELIKAADFEKDLAKYKDKVVVVDFWGTGCIPCRKEFPNLVKMQQKYQNEGLICFSMATDDLTDQPEGRDLKADVLKFLKEKNATFQNYLVSDPPKEWEKVWPSVVALPVVRVYGRDGKLAQEFPVMDKDGKPKGFDYEHDVEPLVKKLLETK